MTRLLEKDKKKYLLLVLGFLIGIGLLIYGSLGGEEKKNEDASLPEAEVYRVSLEEEIGRLCRGYLGEEVRVLVSLEGGYEYVYAKDERGECITVGSGSGREAVVEKIMPPKIGGVGIVCRHADPKERAELVTLLSAALGIGANKIYISS